MSTDLTAGILTITWRGNEPEPHIMTFDDWRTNEAKCREWLIQAYPIMTPDERKTIRIVENGMKCTNRWIGDTEKALREVGWAMLFPLYVERPAPACPDCHKLLIKIGRYEDSKVRAICLDCKREFSLTNGEYYVTLCDEDQL